MEQTKAQKDKFQQMVKEASPNTKTVTNCIKAFIVGGLICDLGQLIQKTIISMGQSKDNAAMYTSVILIFTAILLTGLGVYDNIGKFAGAGSIVPITGFANSVAAPAIEYKKEGYILGVGAKIFVVAGPVIVYGVATSVLVGIVYYFAK